MASTEFVIAHQVGYEHYYFTGCNCHNTPQFSLNRAEAKIYTDYGEAKKMTWLQNGHVTVEPGETVQP